MSGIFKKMIVLLGAVCILGGCVNSVPDNNDATAEASVAAEESTEAVETAAVIDISPLINTTTAPESTENGEQSETEKQTEESTGEQTSESQTPEFVDEFELKEHTSWEISYSLPSGRYVGTQSIELSAPQGAQIYYTLDGNDPDEESLKYSGPVELSCTQGTNIYALKAVYYKNGQASAITQQIYYLHVEKALVPEVDIICITSDEDNLYDYDKGILVEGATYDKNVEEGQTSGYIKGNYSMRGDEWIRDAYVTMITREGEVVLDQNIGIAVSGNTSTVLQTKSLMLIAGEEYDADVDKFTFTQYSYDTNGAPYSYVTSYKKFRLRSGSQDLAFLNIRSALVERLCEQAGFDGCTATHRVLVYLNNKPYGIFDMQQTYTDGYLSKKFSLPDSEAVTKIKGGEDVFLHDSGTRKLFYADLTKEENVEALEAAVDMDNFLLYYAINCILGNTDWPQSNLEAWKYTGEANPDNPYTDGRWRFLVYDTDLIFQCEADPDYFEGSKGDIISYLVDPTTYFRNRSAFRNLMKSERYRDKFIAIICDLLNTTFSIENVNTVIDEELAKIADANLVYWGDYYIETFINDYVASFRKRVNERLGEIEDCLLNAQLIDSRDKYSINVFGSEGAVIYINGIAVSDEESYGCSYYADTQVQIHASALPGYSIEVLLVNDQEFAGGAYSAEAGEVVRLSVKARRQECALAITKIIASGDNEMIVVTNVGSQSIDLGSYYLSDSLDELTKCSLGRGNSELKSGESAAFYGKKNPFDAPDYKLSFNIGKFDYIYLADEAGNVLDCVYVPRLSKGECYERVSTTGEWGHVRVGG